MRRRLAGDERGAVLLFVLLFLAVIGVIVGAISTELAAQFRLSTVAASRAGVASAAEAGVETAIAVLDHEIDQPVRTWCRTPAAGILRIEGSDLLVPELNGATVRVRCENRRGFVRRTPPGTPYGFAIVTTGSAGTALRVRAGAAPAILGSVFLSGPVEIPDGTVVPVEEGGAAVSQPPCEREEDADPPDPLRDPACVTWGWREAQPRSTLPATPPTEQPAPVLVTDDPDEPPSATNRIVCAIFFPGRYESAFSVLLDAQLDAVGYPTDLAFDRYLASGTYYITAGDVLTPSATYLDSGSSYVGGEPRPGDAPAERTACADDTRAREWAATVGAPTTITGDGVRLVLGGTGRLRVRSGALVLHTGGDQTRGEALSRRLPPPYSVRTVRPGDPAGWDVWAFSGSAFNNDPLPPGAPPVVDLRGALDAENASVVLAGNASGAPVARAGVAAESATLDGTSPSGAHLVRAWYADGPRTVRLLSTATSKEGIRAVSVALVEVGDGPAPGRIVVRSRRTEVGSG